MPGRRAPREIFDEERGVFDRRRTSTNPPVPIPVTYYEGDYMNFYTALP
jgi:hypothetical protein